ncbi:HPr family phosphocarrier protein [Maribacter halichondriae]|uniref:HPr family phosphocarrier protein n=1 Tax=Maribacter halichondriae TaxID=2980554 RepID=UPI002359F733|nr:HPr family phosphocarrier protein [Maribacter sp. Hal144]
MVKNTVTVTDEIGFHARTASLFAKKAGSFASTVQVTYNDKTINGKSMLAIMTLGVKSNATVEVSADGEDESEALQALIEFVQNNFNS